MGNASPRFFVANNFVESAVEFPTGSAINPWATTPRYHLHLLDERPRWLSIPYLRVIIFTVMFEEFYDRSRNIPDELEDEDAGR